jgi:phospholipid N-methyltransferase
MNHHPHNVIPAKTAPNPPRREPRSDWWLVFRKFLTQGTSIASFAPSSRFLATRLVKGINFDRARCIVELGAGTGPITTELVRRAGPGTKLIAIELDGDFCQRLREKFPSVEIVQGDAAQLDTILAERGIGHADHVISGLPLPSFSPRLRDAIVAASVRALMPQGTFRQITNMPWAWYALYKSYFSDVRFRFVPLNIPPGGVYVCRGYIRNGTPNGKVHLNGDGAAGKIAG